MNDRFKNNKNQKQQDKPAKKGRWDNPAVNMTVHVIMGTFIFLLVATAAYGIDLYVHWLQAHGATTYLVFLLSGFANALVTLDVACALWYIIKKIADEFCDDSDE
ncbi:hypothetical protein [Massilia sp. LjRoot122]|uniref:hypothetical protein n=1 Tax=Massilia sp. LjRoot122 TaxID=3342257 RepID=UPI003ED00906